MGLLNTVASSHEKYLIYKRGSAELVREVTGGGGFSNADHLRTLSKDIRDGKKSQDAAYETKLKGLVSNLKFTDRFLILRAKSTGAWPSVRGTTVSGTVPSATEFRDFLCAPYNGYPLNL